mgnify:CR=1 FL=1
MKALLQRVVSASVSAAGDKIAEIGPGILVFLGVVKGDAVADADALAAKCCEFRIFEDDDGRMNLSILDAGGKILVVSQFTLYADTRKGRRPSWNAAAPGPVAQPLVEALAEAIRSYAVPVTTGVFGADMAVELVNDGPVTLVLDSSTGGR